MNDLNLAPEPIAVTGLQFVAAWRPIIPRTAFDTICDKYAVPFQTASLEKRVEKPPSAPAEWSPVFVFQFPGCLTDEENRRMTGSFTRYGVLATLMKRALNATADSGVKRR
jgi:hypothetical protein